MLVDDEVDLVEIMEFLIQNSFSAETIIYKAFSGNEAIKLLKEHSIDACICDHNMPDGMGSDVLKFIIDSKKSTKFILCSTVTPADKPEQYPAAHVFSSIQKPEVGQGLEKLKNLLETEQKTQQREEYIPVSLYLLELMEKTPADVYIKMSETHYAKVLKANEDFTAEDKEKYSTKPLKMLYLKKGEQKDSVDKQIARALEKIMEHKQLPLEDKLSITHTQLVELIKFAGITPTLAEMSKKNIQQSVVFINKNPVLADFWKRMVLIGDYPSKLYTLHTLLSSVVIRKMQWFSEATMFKLTLAAFLQDISLDSISLMELCDYHEFLLNEGRFSRAEIKRYMEHPQRAVEIISTFKEIPPDIDRILIEQNEMPNGDGFPKKLNATQLGPLSCVFILTGILARFVLREGSKFDLREFVLLVEEKGYSKGNFREAFEAIKKMI